MSVRLTEEVVWARLSRTPPPFLPSRAIRRKGLKGRGLRYETKVLATLAARSGDLLLPHPWFLYRTASSPILWCQPDGLYIRPDLGIVWVIEVKLKHTASAFFQLFDLYLPVLRCLLPKELWSIRLSEVCRWYDPSTVVPGPHALRPRITDVKENEMGVTIWTP